jgi:hypothetical protein
MWSGAWWPYLFAFIDNAGEVEEHTTDHDTVTLDEDSASKYMNWDYLIGAQHKPRHEDISNGRSNA